MAPLLVFAAWVALAVVVRQKLRKWLMRDAD